MCALLQSKHAGLEPLPGRIGVGLAPEAQLLLGGVDGEAHVFAGPARVHPPAFVQDGDVAVGFDLAHEVDEPGRDRQTRRGKQGQVIGVQGADGRPLAHLGGRGAAQRRRAVACVIPVMATFIPGYPPGRLYILTCS